MDEIKKERLKQSTLNSFSSSSFYSSPKVGRFAMKMKSTQRRKAMNSPRNGSPTRFRRLMLSSINKASSSGSSSKPTSPTTPARMINVKSSPEKKACCASPPPMSNSQSPVLADNTDAETSDDNLLHKKTQVTIVEDDDNDDDEYVLAPQTPPSINSYGDYSDDIICVDSTKKLDMEELHKDMENIVNNLMSEGIPLEDIKPKQVATRLNNLYDKDFLENVGSVEKLLDEVKKGINTELARSVIESSIEVAPGIRQYDLDTLDVGEWLNDVVVNSYLELLVRESDPKENGVWLVISSFFYEEIQRRSKKKSSSLPSNWHLSCNLLIPICITSHWSLLHVDVEEKKVVVYNSLEPTDVDEEAAETVFEYIKSEYELVTNQKVEWKMINEAKASIQENHSDCGVYVCMFARMLIFKLGGHLKTEYVTDFRDWMKREIIVNKLIFT